jgi:uncharacterized cysteine cluster protein YcgN (CxxCxxCC family)
MDLTERNKMVNDCLKLLPNIADSTKKIIKDIMYQKNACGQYLVKDEQDMKSLVNYLGSYSTQ